MLLDEVILAEGQPYDCFIFDDGPLGLAVTKTIPDLREVGGTMIPAMIVPWTCPRDGIPLQVGSDQLSCAIGHAFPIVRGVPVFTSHRSDVASFGKQWERFATTQLDSRTGLNVSQSRLRKALGDQAYAKLGSQTVLEVGCGAGRFTEVLLGAGATVVSTDLSSAAQVNARLFPLSDRHAVAQADALQLPFPPTTFDLVLALGMLQHTPNPPMTIRALMQQAKPGGLVVFDHYAKTFSTTLQTKPLVRGVLRRLPPEMAMRMSDDLYTMLAPLHRLVGTTLLRSLLVRISPITYFTDEFPGLSDELREEWGRLDTHDSLTDTYKWRVTKSALVDCLRRHTKEFEVVSGDNGWIARARVPSRDQ